LKNQLINMLEYSINKVDTVIRDLAKKHNLPVPVVENIVKFPYLLTHEFMKSKVIDKPIYHLFIGKFHVKDRRLEHFGLSRDGEVSRDSTRVVKPSMEGSGSREDS
jgi:hypothetical protein